MPEARVPMSIWFSPSDYEEICKHAAGEGIRASAWVRARIADALGDRVGVEVRRLSEGARRLAKWIPAQQGNTFAAAHEMLAMTPERMAALAAGAEEPTTREKQLMKNNAFIPIRDWTA